MRSEGEALVHALGRHGVVVDSALSDAGEDWAVAAATQIPRADLMCVLINAGDELKRSVQYETRLMLKHCWERPDVRIVMVAPAVDDIPRALRHQPFVLYFSHDEFAPSRRGWETFVEKFVSRILRPGETASNEPPEPFSEAEIHDWRNRIVHVGKSALSDDPTQSARLRLQLASDLEHIRSHLFRADAAGISIDSEEGQKALDRVVLARAIGDDTLAAEYYNMVRYIYETSPPESPFQQAEFWNGFGLVALDTTDYQAAKDSFARAVETDERVLGSDHPASIAARYNLGLACESLGEAAEAIDSYERALQAAQVTLGDNHPQTADIAYKLGLMLESQGDLDRARSLIKLAATTYKNVRPDNSPELVAAQEQVARLESVE
jgi:hypothetical protein